MSRQWVNDAVRAIERDFHRSADTHLVPFDVPALPNIRMYLKDESTHLTGSLKHRLARSLFLHGLCNGAIDENTTLVEASSGSTAVSEAYFARLLGLPFIAVMPAGTSAAKVAQIEFYGGRCHFVDDPTAVYAEAARLAEDCNGHNLDQFTNAAQATDWRGNNNIAESIFEQMEQEHFPVPRWIVVGAGTGGTSATIGRYIRYRCCDTELCVVDPTRSVFYDAFVKRTNDVTLAGDAGSGIEGIGRPRVEPSFIPDVIDRMIEVDNTASFASMHFLERVTGRRYGGSTGTNLFGVMLLAAEMAERGEEGAIVTLACDPGDRYLTTYYDREWLEQNGHDIDHYLERMEAWYRTGEWTLDCVPCKDSAEAGRAAAVAS
ncbi:MAG TPA: PLP-dependent cysteine synthase family protein [Thermomicrobiales bacterium]|nr:PLP-dependent cysteine synthase family protein [Thermomicrobiales bacterium]